ncbi:MAG: SPOR domain-containing protein [Burkholderiaceae bacterium]
MRLFSRNKEAAEAVRVDDVPFESLRRSPRGTGNTRKQREKPDSDFDAQAPLDPAETTKTRARRRLVGAIALALVAIVFVPMLFDRTPVPPADDIALVIPDRDTPFEGRRGVPDAGRTPLRPSGDLPTLAPATVVSPVVEAPPPPDAVADTATAVPEKSPGVAPKVAETVVPKPAEKPAAKVAEKPVDKPVDRPRATAAATTDDPRALAALDGRTVVPAAPEAAGNKSYAVQIAAFSAADKARGLRDQLTANGFKSYTESVSTAQGMRTRVRLGPFASHDAADKAKQRLKTMKLDGSVVPL